MFFNSNFQTLSHIAELKRGGFRHILFSLLSNIQNIMWNKFVNNDCSWNSNQMFSVHLQTKLCITQTKEKKPETFFYYFFSSFVKLVNWYKVVFLDHASIMNVEKKVF